MFPADGRAGIFKTDMEPPAINLLEPETSFTVFTDRIFIEGVITDNTGVDELLVNQVPLLIKKGTRVRFSYILNLAHGENSIVFRAKDKSENHVKKQLLITRKRNADVRFEERLSLAVLPFRKNPVFSQLALGVHQRLLSALSKLDRFRLVERQKLAAMIREQQMGSTRLFHPNTALEFGRMALVQAVISGEIVPAEPGFKILAKLVDTETAEVLSVCSVHHPDPCPPVIKDLAWCLALKFNRDLPLVDGYVTDIQGNRIQVNLGRDALKPGRGLIIYRKEPVVHPSTGKILGTDNRILGRAKVKEIMQNSSFALVSGTFKNRIRPMDRVVTR